MFHQPAAFPRLCTWCPKAPDLTKQKMFTDDKDQKEISPWAQELQNADGTLVKNKKFAQITSEIWAKYNGVNNKNSANTLWNENTHLSWAR